MGSRRTKAKRGFGEVDALPSGRFRARYTGPDGARHSAPITFMARIDAEGWLVDQERMISRGEWEPPRRQTREAPLLLLGEYAAAVVGRRRLRPATGTRPSTTASRGLPTTRARRPSMCPGSRSTACATPVQRWPRSWAPRWLSCRPGSGTARRTWPCATSTSLLNATPSWRLGCQRMQPNKPARHRDPGDAWSAMWQLQPCSRLSTCVARVCSTRACWALAGGLWHEHLGGLEFTRNLDRSRVVVGFPDGELPRPHPECAARQREPPSPLCRYRPCCGLRLQGLHKRVFKQVVAHLVGPRSIYGEALLVVVLNVCSRCADGNKGGRPNPAPAPEGVFDRLIRPS